MRWGWRFKRLGLQLLFLLTYPAFPGLRAPSLVRARRRIVELETELAALDTPEGASTLCERHGFGDLLPAYRANMILRDALVALRARIQTPGHDKCKDPLTCPWSEDHEMVQVIDRALQQAGGERQ